MTHPIPRRINRRASLALLSAGAAFPMIARAQAAFPARPLRFVVGYPPGGGSDGVARPLAQRLSDELGQQVVVANVPGATGSIAVDQVARSAPDGYTLLLINVADTVMPALRAKMPYDLSRDLIGVAPIAGGPLALVVNPNLPVKTVRDLIALLKTQPGKLHYGSPGVGNSLHLAGEQFDQMAGTKMVHVPFKGAAEALTATVAGQIEVCFPVLSTAVPLVKAGRLRLLAVTGGNRSPAVPDTPTLSEAGVPGYDRTTWFGVAVPTGTPPAVVARLHAAVTKVTATPEMRAEYAKQNFEVMSASSDQFTAFIRAELARNVKQIQSLGIKPA